MASPRRAVTRAKPVGKSRKAKPTAVPRTRTESLRIQLADQIVSGVLEPGAPLDEQELAARFGVSRTPVREAIRQLSSSGLVSVRPHRGAVVALPTPKQLNDMFEAMAELEALCAGLAAKSMTLIERNELRALHERMEPIAGEEDAERYRERNEAFHSAIYNGSHNGYLAELALITRSRVAPFRRAQFNASGRLASSHREHDRIVQAILQADESAAVTAMRDHIGIVRDVFRQYADIR
jgi:DNA-binding GntR family transcriptional regulator